MASAPYISLPIVSIFSSIERLRSYKNLKLDFPSHIATTASARLFAPAPPLAQWLLTTAASAPADKASLRIRASSASVSELEIVLHQYFHEEENILIS